MRKHLPYGTSNKAIALWVTPGLFLTIAMLTLFRADLNLYVIFWSIFTGIAMTGTQIALNAPSSEKQARFFMADNQLKINRASDLTILKNHEGVMFNFYGKQVEILKNSNPNLKPLKTGEPVKLGRAEGYALKPNAETDSTIRVKNFLAEVEANSETWVVTMVGAGWREEDRTDWAGLLQEIEINK